MLITSLHRIESSRSSSIKKALGLALFFLLPFDHKLTNLTIGLILSLSLIDILKIRKLSSVETFRVHIPWILVALFPYFLISQIVFGGDWQPFEKKLLLVFVPLIFAMNTSFLNNRFRHRIFLAYILGNLLALVVCFVRAIVRSVSFQNGSISFNAKVLQHSGFDFLTSSVMGGNYFFEEQFSVFQHPMYFGLYIVFAQYLIFHVANSTENRIPKGWLISCFIFFSASLFFLSSKSAIICSILLTLYLLLKLRIAPIGKIVCMVSLFIVSILIVYFNPKVRILATDFNVAQLFHPDPNSQTSHGLRILSWNASLNIIKENLLFGVGEGNKENALVSEYCKNGYTIPAREFHNSHNQYFDFLIGGGIIGLAIFLTGLATLFAKSIKRRNVPLLVFLTIFSGMSLFENLLSRHTGLLLFSLFIAFLGSEVETKSAYLEKGENSENVAINSK